MNSPTLEILVAEQDPAIATAICRALRRRGHRVTAAATRREAECSPAPQVLVSDVTLGAESGLDLLETLVKRGSHLHAVMLSAAPNIDDCRRAMRLGASELLSKPFRIGELVEVVEGAPPAPALPAGELSRAFDRDLIATSGNIESCLRELTAYMMRLGMGPTTRARVATASAEVLDNVQRHAHPGSVGAAHIEARMNMHELVVVITDEGCGFDPLETATSPVEAPRGSGIERASMLSEDQRIESVLGRGTRVTQRFSTVPAAFEEESVIDLSELDFLSPELSRRVLEAVLRDRDEAMFNLSPALAVTVGRLLSGTTNTQSAQRALWS